jgi:hypothetical protein
MRAADDLIDMEKRITCTRLVATAIMLSDVLAKKER